MQHILLIFSDISPSITDQQGSEQLNISETFRKKAFKTHYDKEIIPYPVQ